MRSAVLVVLAAATFSSAGWVSAGPPDSMSISSQTIWHSDGRWPTYVMPTKTGFVYVALNNMHDLMPQLGVINLEKKSSELIEVKPTPELKKRWLRAIDERKDGSFIVSATWVEGGLSRSGLLYIDRTGKTLKKAGYGISVGRIAILDHGWVAATLQPPRDPESQDIEKPHHMMSGYFDEETGALATQSAMGWRGDFATFSEQHRDLMVRNVLAIPNGQVLAQPHSALATRLTWTGKHMPDGTPEGIGEGRSTWFESPSQDALKVVAIAPMQVGERLDYVVAWGRRRPGPHDLTKAGHQSYYDKVVLAAYAEGGKQKPYVTTAVESDLYDLTSDGRRVFSVSGSGSGDWRIEEIRVHRPDEK